MEVDVSRKILRSVAGDVIQSAEAVRLRYVTDSLPGIRRVRDGKGFGYLYENKKISDQKVLKRIEALVIPPAWEKVWICAHENGHLQATGYDTKNRKQYRYHPLWIVLRGKTKFYRLSEFGKVLPSIRKQVQKDLKLKGLPKQKILATIISLMEQTNIRIGNKMYEKLYGSFGLSTLKDKNVKLKGNKIRFVFTGKKGINHDISIKNKRLAKIVLHCREIPGSHLFQYYDENNERQPIYSDDVNEYIKQISNKDFTSKDFRTWSGTVECLRALKRIGPGKEITKLKNNIVSAIDEVAQCLGNTRAVCKKYYIHPAVLTC